MNGRRPSDHVELSRCLPNSLKNYVHGTNPLSHITVTTITPRQRNGWNAWEAKQQRGQRAFPPVLDGHDDIVGTSGERSCDQLDFLPASARRLSQHLETFAGSAIAVFNLGRSRSRSRNRIRSHDPSPGPRSLEPPLRSRRPGSWALPTSAPASSIPSLLSRLATSAQTPSPATPSMAAKPTRGPPLLGRR